MRQRRNNYVNMSDLESSFSGGYEYKDGSKYFGQWNVHGLRHGIGHLILSDGTRYDGAFYKGLFTGLGVLQFPDGARFEGEFMRGWFHGCGVFYRADGMKFEGEFRGGKVCGYGLVTYKDGNHGFPRNEGLFMNCRMASRKNCSDIVEKAQWISYSARTQSSLRSTVEKNKTKEGSPRR